MSFEETCLYDNSTIQDVLKSLDASAMQIVLILDSNKSLIGTITDGDVRRAILSGKKLGDLAITIMNRNFFYSINGSIEKNENCIDNPILVRHMPVIDDNKRVVDLIIGEHVYGINNLPNSVVIMAGGKGKRLRPLTANCPKPMICINGTPILEILIKKCIKSGFRKFYLSVNYLKEQIMEYFGDGKSLGVEIKYLIEDKPLGTAGSLKLLPNEIQDPFLVVNGDVLTKMNFVDLLNYHNENKALATMCVREYEYTIPFGVVESTEHIYLKTIHEKPSRSCLVNAGIYIVNPSLLSHLSKNTYMDMPNLLLKASDDSREVCICPIHEYWLDIGRPETLDLAVNTWDSV